MLAKEDEVEVEVTWEDQQMINTFGKLNAKLHELMDEFKAKKEEYANLEDASSEVFMLEDETEKVRYMMGEAYFELSKEEADEFFDKEKEKLQEEMAQNEAEQDKIKQTMAELKVKLYGKFKNSINLEEE